MEIILSKNNVPIRMTDERVHITEEHSELAGMRLDVLDAIANPERILAGSEGELLALKEISPGKKLIIIYRELENDGFVITAFVTTRVHSLEKRKQLWPAS